MDETLFAKEMKAQQAFLELMERAAATRQFYEDAKLPIPDRLARFLGDVAANGRSGRPPRMAAPPPELPPKPLEFADGWLWLKAEELTPATLVLAVLRQFEKPVSSKVVFQKVQEYATEPNYGSILNIGARLSPAVIERTDEGWRLIERGHAPVLHEGYAWGPPSVFVKQEIATYRRMLICHVLQAAPGGLQIMQIVKQLENSPVCYAPVSKDLVKTDIEKLLHDGMVKRIGNSKKWTTTR